MLLMVLTQIFFGIMVCDVVQDSADL